MNKDDIKKISQFLADFRKLNSRLSVNKNLTNPTVKQYPIGIDPAGHVVYGTIPELQDNHVPNLISKRLHIRFDWSAIPATLLRAVDTADLKPPVLFKIPVVLSDSFNGPIHIGLSNLKPFTPQHLEDRIYHICHYTQFKDLRGVWGRYVLDFNDFPSSMLDKIIRQHIEDYNPRFNHSWMGPLTDLCVIKQSKENFQKKAKLSSKKEPNWHNEYVADGQPVDFVDYGGDAPENIYPHNKKTPYYKPHYKPIPTSEPALNATLNTSSDVTIAGITLKLADNPHFKYEQLEQLDRQRAAVARKKKRLFV